MTTTPPRRSWRPALLAWAALAMGALSPLAQLHAAAPEAPITTKATHDLWWADFDALERTNNTLRQPGHLTRDDASELEFFRIGLGNVIYMQSPRREPFLRELEALTLLWATQHPGSAFAHILHAKVLVAHAWSYRGTGYVKDVPPLAWKDFNEYLERAVEYLHAHADVAMSDSSAHLLLLTIGNALGWDDAKMRMLLRDGLNRNPQDVMLYFDMTTHMLPKWGGSPVKLDKYIREVAQATKATYGMGMYARLYSVAADEQFGEALFADSAADWPTMRQGYEDMMTRFPDSPTRLNRYAHMACLAKDKPTLQRLLDQLGPALDATHWGSNPERSLETCQRWAQQT